MADIRISDFGARRRRACRDASAFGKGEQPNEMLSKNEKSQTDAADENGSALLRRQLLGRFAVSFRFGV